ncbi:MAG: efflux RND transporter periplasmic adaptor subunit [Rhodothermales bacterium]|nr:efflux RND transporter periplasmic adaptor subunit [Rhodothermales bacterium]MBO6779252.1 efflux RND transporter periplasmic adaptor subunit [Rhodothermales bacterium]
MKRRYIIGAVLVVVVAAAALLGRDTAVSTEVAVVEQGPVVQTVSEDGVTRLREQFVITAPVGGTVSRIELREGERVATGQVVARITPAPNDPRQAAVLDARIAAGAAQTEALESRVAQADAVLSQARRDLSRSDALAQDSIISAAELERAQLAMASAERELEAARSGLSTARADLQASQAAARQGGDLLVRTPADGQVLRIPERSARLVGPGEPLLVVGDAGGLEVLIDVRSQDAVRVRAGQAVRIDGWGGSRVLTGSVRLVEPAAFTKISSLGVEEQRVNVVVDLGESPAGLGAGFRVDAAIQADRKENVLRVPSTALFRDADSWQVYAVQDGRAALTSVTPGVITPEWAEIQAGLEDGDRVVRFPSDLIQDGTRISGG